LLRPGGGSVGSWLLLNSDIKSLFGGNGDRKETKESHGDVADPSSPSTSFVFVVTEIDTRVDGTHTFTI